MAKKEEKKEEKTSILEKIFVKANLDNIDEILAEHKDSMIEPDKEFYNYMRDKFEEKGLKIGDVISDADIDKKYGYKLLNYQEKTTPQRDLILRICYAAKLNLDETQKALRLYGMSELYSKSTRDVIMMAMFNDRPGDIFDFNDKLIEKGEKPLKASGKEE